jgi:hypothetical protein
MMQLQSNFLIQIALPCKNHDVYSVLLEGHALMLYDLNNIMQETQIFHAQDQQQIMYFHDVKFNKVHILVQAVHAKSLHFSYHNVNFVLDPHRKCIVQLR